MCFSLANRSRRVSRYTTPEAEPLIQHGSVHDVGPNRMTLRLGAHVPLGLGGCGTAAIRLAWRVGTVRLKYVLGSAQLHT